MMIGEYEFDEIFFYNPDAPEAADRALLPYRSFTLLFFLVFMVIMTIIIMNLLVGLAVDNIKMVQENAALQRLAMQVELNLDVEKLLPEWIRRRFMVKEETVYPNKRIGILSRILNDNSTLNQLAQAVVAKGHEVGMSKMLLRKLGKRKTCFLFLLPDPPAASGGEGGQPGEQDQADQGEHEDPEPGPGLHEEPPGEDGQGPGARLRGGGQRKLTVVRLQL